MNIIISNSNVDDFGKKGTVIELVIIMFLNTINANMVR